MPTRVNMWVGASLKRGAALDGRRSRPRRIPFQRRGPGVVQDFAAMSDAEVAARRRETQDVDRWMDTHPAVSVESGCAVCDGSWGVDWTDADFYVEFGRIPVTVEQANELVAAERCDLCGRAHQVLYMSVTAAGAPDDAEPILNWICCGSG